MKKTKDLWNSFIVWMGTETSAWIRLGICLAIVFLIKFCCK